MMTGLPVSDLTSIQYSPGGHPQPSAAVASATSASEPPALSDASASPAPAPASSPAATPACRQAGLIMSATARTARRQSGAGLMPMKVGVQVREIYSSGASISEYRERGSL